MAYSALPAKVAGDTITLTNYDNIRDNFVAGVPDIFTAKGDIAAATGANVATRIGIETDGSILIALSAESAGLKWKIVPAARVYNDANIDPATSSWVTLTFNQERYDAEGCHSIVSNTGRLTVPTGGTGVYGMGGSIELDTSGFGAGSQNYGIRIRLNATTILASDYQNRNQLNFDMSFVIATEYELVVDDYIELQVYVGNNVDVLALSNYSPEFWFSWLRAIP